MKPPPRLRGVRAELRPVEIADAVWIAAMLAEPEVAPWWGEWDVIRVERELIADEEEVWLAIEVAGEPAGIVGWWEEDDPQYHWAGIDISLRSAFLGQRLGRDAVATLARWLFDEGGHHRVTIDPAAENARAIRCYESVGFRPVGVMRRYERVGSGEFRDGLLMDLLPEELRAPAASMDPQAGPR